MQCVRIYIAPYVILFHRRSRNREEKSGETEGKQHRRTKGATGMGQQGDKSGKRHRRAGQWPDKAETKTVICRVGSERSPCPVLMCSWRQEADAFHGAGYVSVCIVTAGWNKISPSGFFPFDPVFMRRRSLRLPSPNPFPNSDGNTGAFFRAENYRREFSVPKTGGLNVEVFALRVIFSGGLAK